MRSIIARALVLLAIAAPAAGAQSYKKPLIINRTQWGGTVDVNYTGCRTDKITIGGVFAGSPKSTTGVNQTTATSSIRRGMCLISSVNASLNGVTKPVQNYKSSGTSYYKFYIVERGDTVVVLSEAELNKQ
jgi:hypothetical protein